MDTDRVIDLLKRRQKIKQMIGNLATSDPVEDSIGVELMGTTVIMDGPQFAVVRPIVAKSLADMVGAIDHQLLEQGVTIK